MPSPALIVAMLALVVALGGTSYAAVNLGKNSVGSKQLKNNAVTAKKVKKNAVTSPKVKNGSLLAEDFESGQLNARGPAGGDLEGSYPDPQIAPQSVGPAEIGVVPAARALATGTQSVATSTPVIFDLDTAAFDTAGMFSAPSNALIAPVAGIYQLTGAVSWSSSATGPRQARLFVNNLIVGNSTINAGGSANIRQTVAALTEVNEGDAIKIGGFQGSGISLDTVLFTGIGAVSLSAVWVAPLPSP